MAIFGIVLIFAAHLPKHTEKKKKIYIYAPVVKLVDTPDLGSGASRREGSSPFRRTTKTKEEFPQRIFLFLFTLVLTIFFYFSNQIKRL